MNGWTFSQNPHKRGQSHTTTTAFSRHSHAASSDVELEQEENVKITLATKAWSFTTLCRRKMQTYSLPAFCWDLTRRVARSIHTIRHPVTFGSSVPLWPVLSTRRIRLIQATTSWDEGLAGLSRLMKPLLKHRNTIAPSSAALPHLTPLSKLHPHILFLQLTLETSDTMLLLQSSEM